MIYRGTRQASDGLPWAREEDRVALCQDLPFWPIIKIPASSEPLTCLVQDPMFFCPPSPRQGRSLPPSTLRPEACLPWVRRPGPSKMCQVSVLNLVPTIPAGSVLPISAVEDTNGRTSPFLFVCLFDVFSHTVSCHQGNHHTVCDFSTGPGPRRWPLVGTSNGAGIDRHSRAMLPEEAEVGALGDEEGQRTSAVQKAPPDSGAIVVGGGGAPFSL